MPIHSSTRRCFLSFRWGTRRPPARRRCRPLAASAREGCPRPSMPTCPVSRPTAARSARRCGDSARTTSRHQARRTDRSSRSGIRNAKKARHHVCCSQHSVSPKLLVTTNGTATAAIDVSGASLLVVLAKNNYVGITTAIVPVAALSDHVETVHMAGGYRASGLHSNYDCRMTLTTFTGRDAYTNGTNRVSETQWAVYGLL